MASTLQYLPLAESRSAAAVGNNVIGAVIDYKSPYQTSAKDHNWMQTISIWDGSLSEEQKFGQKLRFFMNTEQELPKVLDQGDILIAQNLGCYNNRGDFILTSTHSTRWIVFPIKILKSLKAKPTRVSEKDFITNSPRYAGLQNFIDAYTLHKEWSSHNKGRGPITALDAAPSLMVGDAAIAQRDRFSLIQDMRPERFYDVVAHVIKIHQNSMNGNVTIHVSDYSPHEHSALYNHEDPRHATNEQEFPDYMVGAPSSPPKKDGFKCPYGKRTIQVTLWPPHSSYAVSKVEQGSYVLLKNMCTKSRVGYMEGALHGDRQYPDRVNIRVFIKPAEDQRLVELLERRKAYWMQYDLEAKTEHLNGHHPNGHHPNKGEKRKAPDAPETEQRLSKKARRKAKYAEDAILDPNKSNTSKPQRSHPHHPNAPMTANAKGLNPNLVCAHLATACTPIADIVSGVYNRHTFGTSTNAVKMQLPFQNAHYRAKVRVVDFYPPDLADFAVPVKERPMDCLSPVRSALLDSQGREVESEEGGEDDGFMDMRLASQGGAYDHDEDVTWEWRFGLRIEDAGRPPAKGEARSQMVVWIGNEEGQELMNKDACDLRKSDRRLKNLREAMFTLWGDLEEWKGRELERAKDEEAKRKERAGMDPGVGKALEELQDGMKADEVEKRAEGLPFECCLREYGVKREGGHWQRHFQMFGVVIKQ